MDRFFSAVARRAAVEMGRSYSFVMACVLIVAWGVSGPFFNYSDTWQLVINTSTTICTFLMVFLLQNSQNRDTVEIKLKLDELIAANDTARNKMMGLDRLSENQLGALQQAFTHLSDKEAPLDQPHE